MSFPSFLMKIIEGFNYQVVSTVNTRDPQVRYGRFFTDLLAESSDGLGALGLPTGRRGIVGEEEGE